MTYGVLDSKEFGDESGGVWDSTVVAVELDGEEEDAGADGIDGRYVEEVFNKVQYNKRSQKWFYSKSKGSTKSSKKTTCPTISPLFYFTQDSTPTTRPSSTS